MKYNIYYDCSWSAITYSRVGSVYAMENLHIIDCSSYDGHFETSNINDAFKYQEWLCEFYKNEGYKFDIREA